MFATIDGVLFNKDKSTLVRYPSLKEEKFYKQMYMLEEIQAGLDGERGNFNRNFIDDNT